MADTIKLDIPTSVAERIARTSALQILQWFKDGSLNNEQAVAAFIDWRDCTHPPAPAVGAEDVARALAADLLKKDGNHGCLIPNSAQLDSFIIRGHVDLTSLADAILSLLSGQGERESKS